MNTQPAKLLTETELELMTILWRLGEGNVHSVMEQLHPARRLAYTSVSTILRILEEKNVVTARKEGRGHIYIPAISKSDYEAASVKHMVTTLFSGNSSALVKQLLNSSDLDEKELAEIKTILAQKDL